MLTLSPRRAFLEQATAIAHHLVAVGGVASGQDVLGSAVADAIHSAAKAFEGAEAADLVKIAFSQVRSVASGPSALFRPHSRPRCGDTSL